MEGQKNTHKQNYIQINAPHETNSRGNKKHTEKEKQKASSLKNTVSVWTTQSCLSAVHFKELCLVSHLSLRKHVKRSPVDFSQGLTSSEFFH